MSEQGLVYCPKCRTQHLWICITSHDLYWCPKCDTQYDEKLDPMDGWVLQPVKEDNYQDDVY